MNNLALICDESGKVKGLFIVRKSKIRKEFLQKDSIGNFHGYRLKNEQVMLIQLLKIKTDPYIRYSETHMKLRHTFSLHAKSFKGLNWMPT